MNNFTKTLIPFLLIISTLFAAFAMGWLEWEINTTITEGHKATIAAIVVGRFVLFLVMGYIRPQSQTKSNWVAFFNVIIFLSVAWYAHNIPNIDLNEKLSYHTLNLVLFFLEWGLSFFITTERGATVKQIEEAEEKRVNEIWEKEQAGWESRLKEYKDKANAYEPLMKELENKLNESEPIVKEYERIAHLVGTVFSVHNVTYYIDPIAGVLHSFPRKVNEITLASGEVITKTTNNN